ncbi:MAG: phosphogluconate dehydrogenase (NAD(+)-dependent, decarboxylating) [Dehalococcoidia bacterium]
MEIGFIGLGKMGGNMVERLTRHGEHQVVAYDQSTEVTQQYAGANVRVASSPAEIVSLLKPPRAVWIMVPAGDPVDQTIAALTPGMQQGDIIVDGGNSYFRDSQRRAKELEPQGIRFVDVGTSGGIWGLKIGYCMMIGGERVAYDYLKPALTTLAPEQGEAYMGPSGAGHFVKMVHNGIEYGLMQAYAEGFEILKKSEFSLDLPGIGEIWQHGSVVRSWLLELATDALRKEPNLDSVKGYVVDSGEGRWTVQAAIDEDVPAPVIALSLMARFQSRDPNSFGNKLLAALRNEFGGHAIVKE